MPADLQHHQFEDVNGLSRLVAEQVDGPAIVLSHGWPELWHSWRHQIPALADAGFRALAPDQRGYGGTTAPGPSTPASVTPKPQTTATCHSPICAPVVTAAATDPVPKSTRMNVPAVSAT